MTPHEALAEHRLIDALKLQSEIARDNPDAAALLFLFELQTVANRLREAWDTVNAIRSDDAAWPKALRWYRRLLRCANRRLHGRKPTFVNDVPRHAIRRWQAIRAEEPATALDRIDRADHATPHVLGHIDGREFDGLRDADDRFASVLEAFIGGRYVWLPWEQLRRVTIAPATRLLDSAYRPARVRFSDGEEVNAILPLIYPKSETEDVFLLGTETDHVSPDGGPVRCVGGKLLLIGEEELALGNVSQLEIRAWV